MPKLPPLACRNCFDEFDAARVDNYDGPDDDGLCVECRAEDTEPATVTIRAPYPIHVVIDNTHERI